MKLRIAIAVIAGALVSGATPASAHPGAFVVIGTMNTSGTWAPIGQCVNGGPPPHGTLCPSFNTWAINPGTTGVGSHNTSSETVQITANGTFNGYCGLATGQGVVTFSGVTNFTASVSFLWQGTTIVLTGSGGGETLYVVLLVQPTSGNCLTLASVALLAAGSAHMS